MKLALKSLPLLVLTLAAPAVWSADHLVVLKNKAFAPETLVIKVGDSVTFRNDDPFDHNLTSLSPAKPFELDALGSGASHKISFDQAGKVQVDCAQHGAMHLNLQVNQ